MAIVFHVIPSLSSVASTGDVSLKWKHMFFPAHGYAENLFITQHSKLRKISSALPYPRCGNAAQGCGLGSFPSDTDDERLHRIRGDFTSVLNFLKMGATQ
jgi:hypothetical protein